MILYCNSANVMEDIMSSVQASSKKPKVLFWIVLGNARVFGAEASKHGSLISVPFVFELCVVLQVVKSGVFICL